MTRFILQRTGLAVVTLLLLSVVVFALSHITGSPVDVMLPPYATAAEREAMIVRLGLDKPLHVQYLTFLTGAARGDFGDSIRTGQPAMSMVSTRIWPSISLATGAIAFAIALSLPLAVLAATRAGRAWDQIAMTVATLGQSVPAFLLSILAVLVFAQILGWLPAQGSDSWRHYILPVVTMGWTISAGVTRLLRSSLLEVSGSEFVKLARAKGLSERVVMWKHVLRNSLIPVVTYVGYMYGLIIAAAVATETVFGWPGMGRLAYEAISWRDFPVLQAVVLTWGVIIVFFNFLVDLLYGVLDPRISR